MLSLSVTDTDNNVHKLVFSVTAISQALHSLGDTFIGQHHYLQLSCQAAAEHMCNVHNLVFKRASLIPVYILKRVSGFLF